MSLLFKKSNKKWITFSNNTDRTHESLILYTMLYGHKYQFILIKILSGKYIIQLIMTYVTCSLIHATKGAKYAI